MQLFLDLGDVFTKGIAVDAGRTQRVRFPSVVARRLLDAGETSLLVDEADGLLRPDDFDASEFPRTRSYPGGEEFLSEVRDQVGAEARFAGWPAAAYGGDRELLGRHPTLENIDALVRKALILLSGDGFDCADVDLVLTVDVGAKADAIARYAEATPRSTALVARGFKRQATRRIGVELRARIVDAAGCAVAALPDDAGVDPAEGLLLIDVGYFRTKLSLVSAVGFEHQDVADLGVSDCVRRILRDGQDQGLVEDELAVMRALERPTGAGLEVGGRRFDIARPLASALRALEEEVARAAQRAVVDQYERRGAVCRAAAIAGGGSVIAGAGLAARLRELELGLDAVWVADDAAFFLASGARHHSNSAR